ncbi:MAG: hypothetical protein KJO08_09920 [Gammaproteobacteria bacterium]|nr:hypothetical protein [Gammaproteobacteria bacterium]NNJ85371.1 hypothetical protein [Gammaproteobacteria bacterium]
MSSRHWMFAAVFGTGLLLVANHSAAEPKQALLAFADPVESKDDDRHKWNGLPPGSGREDVFYTCQTCHSLQIVKQQGLGRSSWDETLTWMVEEQGLKEPDTQVRERILDYLAEHFGLGR